MIEWVSIFSYFSSCFAEGGIVLYESEYVLELGERIDADYLSMVCFEINQMLTPNSH